MREIRIAFIPIVRPIFRGASMGLREESLKTLETIKDDLCVTIAYQVQPIAKEAEAIACVKAINAFFSWISQLRWVGRAQSEQTFLANILHHRLPHHLTWGRNDYEQAMLECCCWMGYQPLEANPQANNGLVSWPM